MSRKWQTTVTGRAYHKKYRDDPTHKARQRLLNALYAQTEKGKLFRRTSNRNWATKNPLTRIFASARARAKARGLNFSLTLSDLVLVTHCPALGILLDYSYGTKQGRWQANSPSLDRIDPCHGYIPGNVQILSMKANQIKTNASAKEVMRVALFMRG